MDLLVTTSTAAKIMGCADSTLSQFTHRLHAVVRMVDRNERGRGGKALWPADIIQKAANLRAEAARCGKTIGTARAIELVAGVRSPTSGWKPDGSAWHVQPSSSTLTSQ